MWWPLELGMALALRSAQKHSPWFCIHEELNYTINANFPPQPLEKSTASNTLILVWWDLHQPSKLLELYKNEFVVVLMVVCSNRRRKLMWVNEIIQLQQWTSIQQACSLLLGPGIVFALHLIRLSPSQGWVLSEEGVKAPSRYPQVSSLLMIVTTCKWDEIPSPGKVLKGKKDLKRNYQPCEWNPILTLAAWTAEL